MVEDAKLLPLPVKALAINAQRQDVLSHIAPTQSLQNPVVEQTTLLADRLYQACSNEVNVPKALLKI